MHAVATHARRPAVFWLRIALAFAITPPSPVLTIALPIFVFDGIWASPTPEMRGFLATVTVLGAAFGYPGAVLLGVPFFIRFMRTGRLTRGRFAAVGALIGMLSPLSLVLLELFDDPGGTTLADMAAAGISLTPLSLLICAPLGAYAGLVFWYIARPDRRPVAATA